MMSNTKKTILVVGLVFGAAVTGAQTPALAPHPPLAPFANADTTRNVIGHVDFSVYHTPIDCLAALRSARMELVREPERDTLPARQRAAYTLAPAVRAIGTRCQAQYAVSAITIPREMEAALTLAVMLGDSAQSAAALERWLALPQTADPRAKGETPAQTTARRMVSAFHAYMDRGEPFHDSDISIARESDIAVARTLVARMAALGPPFQGDRLVMQELLMYNEFQRAALVAPVDRQRKLAAGMALLAARDSVAQTGVIAKLGLVEVFNGLDQLIFLDPQGTVAFADSVVKTWKSPKMQGVAALLQQQARAQTEGIGQPVPPLPAQFWYNAHGAARWPTPGRVSLLVMGDNQTGLDIEDAAVIRRLAERYGARGLQITVVHKTQGYWLRGGTATGPKTAAQEAVMDSVYYLNYLKLPVTVAIVESPLQTLGNGWVQPRYPMLPYEVANMGWHAVLADTTGRLVRKFMGVPEREISAYLDRLVGVATRNVKSSVPSSAATDQKQSR